jgi:hypothetical protein
MENRGSNRESRIENRGIKNRGSRTENLRIESRIEDRGSRIEDWIDIENRGSRMGLVKPGRKKMCVTKLCVGVKNCVWESCVTKGRGCVKLLCVEVYVCKFVCVKEMCVTCVRVCVRGCVTKLRMEKSCVEVCVKEL